MDLSPDISLHCAIASVAKGDTGHLTKLRLR
jgi:hypothetical protein